MKQVPRQLEKTKPIILVRICCSVIVSQNRDEHYHGCWADAWAIRMAVTVQILQTYCTVLWNRTFLKNIANWRITSKNNTVSVPTWLLRKKYPMSFSCNWDISSIILIRRTDKRLLCHDRTRNPTSNWMKIFPAYIGRIIWPNPGM